MQKERGGRKIFLSVLEKIFSWNLFWRFICSVTNVIVILFSIYFMMICLAHGLGRLKEWIYLVVGGGYSWIIVEIARFMRRKLGKTRLSR